MGKGIVREVQARAKAVAAVRAFIDATPGWTLFAEMTGELVSVAAEPGGQRLRTPLLRKPVCSTA